MKVTNNAPGLQGVRTKKGVVYLKPGQTRDLEFDKDGLKRLRKLGFFTFGEQVEAEEPEEEEVEAEEDDSEELDLDALKAEADELGIKYHPNIGAEKLKAKIDEHED